MKKFILLLTVLLSLGTLAGAGCNIDNNPSEDNQEAPQTLMRTQDNEEETSPDDSREHNGRHHAPRVHLKRRNGYAVGYKKQLENGEFFIVRFGHGDLPELPDFPGMPEQPELPDTPVAPDDNAN